MDALFIVPTMVSPNVNIRIVPFLAKTIERNIILNNYASLRLALLKKYAHKTGFSEESIEDIITDVLSEVATTTSDEPKTKSSDNKQEQSKHANTAKAQLLKAALGDTTAGRAAEYQEFLPIKGFGNVATSKDSEISAIKPSVFAKDLVELPKGITFFNTLGLEPTFMTLPVSIKSNVLGIGDKMDRNLILGVKCVPYQVKDVADIVALAKSMAGRSEIKKWFFKRWNSVVGSIPFTVPRQIKIHGARGGTAPSMFKDEKQQYDITKDIIFSPSSDELSNPSAIASIMRSRNRATWSTLTVFATSDFDGYDLSEILMTYKDLAKAGWGDMVVVNENRESAFFCTQKMSACYELPFSYMKNIMNLDGVLEYSEISRWTKPFHKVVTIRQAVKGNDKSVKENFNAETEINNILSDK